MGRVEKLEQDVQSLTSDELSQFRAWFSEFDWKLWDHEIERDAKAGKLDALADDALRGHAAGRTTQL